MRVYGDMVRFLYKRLRPAPAREAGENYFPLSIHEARGNDRSRVLVERADFICKALAINESYL